MKHMTIVFSINNKYVPYLSVILHSLFYHLDGKKKCEIVILHKDISEENIVTLKSEFTRDFCCLNFIDMNPIIKGEKFYVGSRLSVETYFRLFLPWILTDKSKVIYLDCDMIVNRDISELWNVNLNGYLLAATRDCGIIGFCYNNNFDRREYTERILKISNMDNYLQAGVLVMNLDAFREKFTLDQIRNIIINNKYRHHDQDILNIICDGQVLFLDQRWDFIIENKKLKMVKSIRMAPGWLLKAYENARENPYIIHYASEQKPWFYSKCEFGDLYWQYARQSVYYDFLVQDKKDFIRINKQLSNKLYSMILYLLNECILPIGSKRRKFIKMIFKGEE